jgi:hypothetical protein
MSQPSLSELAATISANTAKIENYLRSHDLKSPSFDVDAPTGSLVPSDAPELETARSELIDATLMLHDLILGPKEYLMKYTVSTARLLPYLILTYQLTFQSTTGS